MKNIVGDNVGKKILLVEDDEANREMITTILTNMGYVVIDKPDIASALAAVQKDSPIDLVLTDYRLPDADAFTLVAAVRETLPHVPIIMMTAYGDVDIYIKSMSLGVFEYLNKPVNKKELERIVDAALGKFHRQG